MINNLQLRLVSSPGDRGTFSPARSILRRSTAGVLLALFFVFGGGSLNSLIAATSTWTGDTSLSQNWSFGLNWGVTAPTSATTTDLIFAGTTNTGSAGTPLNNDIANPFILNSIAFSSSTSSFFLGGNALRFNGAGDTITQNSASAESIANNIDATAKTGNNTETITLTGDGTGIVTLSGNILVGNGLRDYAITKSGTSTFVLAGANTYTGGTTLTAGTLKLSGSGTLGGTSGALTVNGGMLDLNGTNQGVGNFTGSGGTILNNNTGTNVTLTIGNGNGSGGNYSGVIVDHASGTGTVALTKTGTGTITLSGANTYTGATTISGGTLQLGNGGTTGSLSTSSTITDNGNLTINRSNAVAQGTDFSGGAISGTGSLTQAGSGATTLSAANTYTGGTTVSAGTLFVNNSTGSGTGTNTVTVNGSGTLSGSGTTTGAVNIGGSGAKINPGATAVAVGTLRTGALTLSTASTFSVDMTSTTADQLIVTGAVNLTSASLQLNIPNGTAFTAGQQFTLINNDLADAISGTFSNAPTGTDSIGGYLWVVSYTGGDGNDFLLVAVPEPSTWLAAALALGAIGFSQRKRLRACVSSGARKHF